MKTVVSAALLVLGAALSGCDKPDEGLVVVDNDAPINSLVEFHRLFAPVLQIVQLSTAQAQNVPLESGGVLYVPAQAFVQPSGALATGTVELRVRSLAQPVEMVLGGLPAMSYLRPIESDGQAHLTVRQNGVPLRLRPGYSLTLSLPKNSISSFTGLSQWTGFPVTGSTQTWRQDTARVVLDGIPGGQQYLQTQLRTDTLGWFNMGRLWTTSPTDTTLLRADVSNDPNARVYVMPTQRSGVFMMAWNNQTRLMEMRGVPAGSDLKVFILRVQNGKVLVSAERTALRRGMVFRPTFRALSGQAAADYIRQF